MIRNISAVLLGMVVAFTTVMAVEWLGHQVYPPPPNLDLTDPTQMRILVASMPLGSYVFLLAAWSGGTLLGGLVACRIAAEKPLVFASIIGALMLAATIANLVMIPHPTWFSITAIILIALAVLAAGRFSSAAGQTTRAL